MNNALLLVTLMLASEAHAAPVKAPCRPSCTHRTCGVVAAPAPAARPSFVDLVRDGFAVTAGFRFDGAPDHVCPTLTAPMPPKPPVKVRDPFYIGFRIELPLNDHATLEGAFSRDFTQGPEFNAHVQVNEFIFRKK